MVTGLLGLIIFCADIYALISIIQSRVAAGPKILWCLLVIILPLLGLIVWYVAGPKK